MVWTNALAALLFLAPQSPQTDAYVRCLAANDPVECVAEAGLRQTPGSEYEDLVAAGADRGAARRAPISQRAVARLAARIARGERPTLSPVEAQRVLALFGEVSFYDAGLPEDGRSLWLWPIAMSADVGDLILRQRLLLAAYRADRTADLARLIDEAPLSGRWSPDQRASFASLVAIHGLDADAAEAWLASGGRRARGYDLAGIRLSIDRARLHRAYDAAAAARVAEALLDDGEVPLFFEEDVKALKANGAIAEMRLAAGGLLERGRDTLRAAEDRTDDFGSASILFEAAGDRERALAAAREGAVLTPVAIADRIGDEPLAPAMAAQRANGFGALPVKQLYRLGARQEALANGYLPGRARYLAELEAGGRPDPDWLTEPRIDYELKLVVPALQERNARREAAELLARLRADPQAWRNADAEELMTLAAITGDARQVNEIFERAVRDLDAADDFSGWSAILLAVGKRRADGILADQSP